MFDPSKFTVAPVNTVAICNSEHPVVPYLEGMLLKRIPSKCDKYKDLFFVVLKNGKGIVTYHKCNHYPTLQFHVLTLDEMKVKVAAEESFNSEYEVVNIDTTNKWIGNDIYDLLVAEEVIG